METTTPPVPVGPTSQFGFALTLIGAVGAIVAGIKGNDTATITAGVAALLTGLATLGGRFAQAVVLVRKVANIVDDGFDNDTQIGAAAGELDTTSSTVVPADQGDAGAPS